MKGINSRLFTICFVLILKTALVSLGPDPSHAIYISVISIDHLPGSDSSELCLKVFSNDLVDALKVFAPESKIHSGSDFGEEASLLLSEFGNHHFQFVINGQKSKLTFLRSENNGESTFFYYKMNCPKTWTEVVAQTNLLVDIFPDQKNIIRIVDGANQRYLNLSKNKQKESVKF